MIGDAQSASGIGRRASGVALLLTVLAAAPAQAHDRTNSYSSWDIHGRSAHVVARMWELDVTHFEWGLVPGPERDRRLGEQLTQQLQLLAGGQPCSINTPPRSLNPGPGRMAFEWDVTCPADGALALRTGLLLDVAPSHLHFARLRRDGQPERERVLSESERIWELSDGAGAPGKGNAPQGTSLVGYIRLGIEHILSGYDHLAFVLALLLIGGSVAEVAQVVTGFTVAHSITLGLTVLGYVRPDRAPIEALIGLSIAVVAAENLWLRGPRRRGIPIIVALSLAGLAIAAALGRGKVPSLTLAGLALFTLCYFELLRRTARRHSLRWSVAFLFGLVHGFGFASVLVEAGLASDRIVPALFGFNAGVEIGQLAVVSFIWPALRVVTRGRERAYHMVVDFGSAIIAGLGVFWFVARTFG
ncbi:MAG: HupE/UreJ family protein [Deltaproteobacteria bacterium]|nr:HupE/UreJ family protein [Deltaproteobacteria bacterium]